MLANVGAGGQSPTKVQSRSRSTPQVGRIRLRDACVLSLAMFSERRH